MPRGDASVDSPIVVEGLSKQYPGAVAPALSDVSLTVRKGEIFGVIGRSGAGKSSLIRTLNRLEEPTGGRVLIDGEDIAALKGDALIALRRRIGMIFQHFNLLSAKTVEENVALPLRVAGVGAAETRRRTAELLELVGLLDKRAAYPARLSGGQKQRVGIARALVHRPEVLLCDEATSALDPESTQAILDLLRDINRRLGLTIVLITHEMAVIHEICHRVAVLDHGRVIEEGEVWSVFGNPRHEVTRTLLGVLWHDLPAGLAERLTPSPGRSGDRLAIDLHYTGAGRRPPDLTSIAAAFDGPTNLLYGGIDHIQGRHQGHLMIAVDPQGREEADLLERARPLADEVRRLGYVGTDL